MEQSAKEEIQCFFMRENSERMKYIPNSSFVFIFLYISVQLCHNIKRGLISSPKFLASMSRRLNILFWCQSLRIIEQSAASKTLHFPQTFNCHTGRENSTYKRGNTQQPICRQDPPGTRLQYIQQTCRVTSKMIWFSPFLDEENVLSHCQCHYCSHYLNIKHKVKCISPPGVCRRYQFYTRALLSEPHHWQYWMYCDESKITVDKM